MPIYQVASQHGMLNDELKAKVASAVTDAHVEATGAPRVFVHVFFNEMPGIAYSAGEPDSTITGITGQIREGRTLEQKQKLIKQICSSWSQITGQPQKQVVAGLTEIDSDITMEYGLILPHPGGEPEWFERTPLPSTASRAPACNRGLPARAERSAGRPVRAAAWQRRPYP